MVATDGIGTFLSGSPMENVSFLTVVAPRIATSARGVLGLPGLGACATVMRPQTGTGKGAGMIAMRRAGSRGQKVAFALGVGCTKARSRLAAGLGGTLGRVLIGEIRSATTLSV